MRENHMGLQLVVYDQVCVCVCGGGGGGFKIISLAPLGKPTMGF
jgi:hypothetical protein